MNKYRALLAIAVLGLIAVMMIGCDSGPGAATEIVIGNLQDLSGPTSVWGNAVTRGADLAAAKINAALHSLLAP